MLTYSRKEALNVINYKSNKNLTISCSLTVIFQHFIRVKMCSYVRQTKLKWFVVSITNSIVNINTVEAYSTMNKVKGNIITGFI